jgi:hypothetical protein
VLGSTEKHYSPSKIYQAVLSAKPVLALLHRNSTACDLITKSGAGMLVSFDENDFAEEIQTKFIAVFTGFLNFVRQFPSHGVNREYFNQYSVKNITRELAAVLDEIKNNT